MVIEFISDIAARMLAFRHVVLYKLKPSTFLRGSSAVLKVLVSSSIASQTKVTQEYSQ